MTMAGICHASFKVRNGKQVARFSWSAIFLSLAAAATWGQAQLPEWRVEVRTLAEAKDWAGAMRIVEREIARSPSDTDVRAWRARILTWSDHLGDAEKEYLAILQLSQRDPDTWIGLATVYLRQSRWQQALRALDKAQELDATRADVHVARGRALRAAGDPSGARLEFQRALSLDATSREARDGLKSVRGEPRHELQFGTENDVFNFADANHDGWISLSSAWSPRWSTSFAGSAYHRGGSDAAKFVGSVTVRPKKWGALTLGGARGSNSAVVPGGEVFFDLDRSWKTGEDNFLRGLEFTYGEHWYWYQSARILTLSGNLVVYLPRDWALSITAIGVRNAFSGTGVEWRPSGLARLAFPLLARAEKRVSGNVFFATGSEDFARVDQIGRFASQTYGGGLRFNFTSRQDVTGYVSYQKRTQARTDMGFGFSYGVHF
jgi:tetratricopeptide (TPR) repeat protein